MNIFKVIKSIVLWSYERGTWQYDVLCVAILAFIFLTPGQVFDRRLLADPAYGALETTRTYVSIDEINTKATASHHHIQNLLAEIVASRLQRPVIVRRLEVDTDMEGNIRGYRVWVNLDSGNNTP
jgi:hypothetical protein